MAASGHQTFVTLCDDCKALCDLKASNSVPAAKKDAGASEGVTGLSGGEAKNVLAAGCIGGNVYNISICNGHHDLSGTSADGDDIDSLIEKQREQFWYIEQSESYKKVKETLEKKRLVLITGAPDEGKTTLALQIFDTFRSKVNTGRYYKNFSLVNLKNIREENSVTLLENMFVNPPGEKISQIMKEIESQLLRPIQNSFFIIVCQLFDMKRAKAKLSSDLFRDEYVVNISDINCPDKEKECERKNVLVAVDKNLSETEKIQIANYKPFMIGFPGMCAYYYTMITRISYSHISFPQNFYSNQIQTLIGKDEEKKWLFTMLILCGGEIDFSDTSNINRKLDVVSQMFGKKLLTELEDETKYLIDTYCVWIKPRVARFRYRVLHMACFLTIAQCIPEFISKRCKIEFLDEEQLDEEMSKKNDTKKSEDDSNHGNLQKPEKIRVPEECETLMIEDVKRNVRLKRYCDSLKSPVLDYPVHCNSLLEMLENDEHNNYIRSDDTEKGGNFLYWSSDSGNGDLTSGVLSIPNVSTRDVKSSIIACVEKDNVAALENLERSVKKCGRKNLRFDIDFTNESGRTPLMLASMYGHVKMVRHILKLGGNMSTTDNKGQNCVHVAADKDHIEVFQLLTTEDQGHVLNSKDVNGFTPYMVALKKRGKVSEYLSPKYPTDVARIKSSKERENLENVNANSLRLACMHDKVGEVQQILAKGKVKIDKKCTMTEETPVLIAANFGSRKVFDFLVREGCDVTVVNDDGCNILHAACFGGNVDIVKYILSHNLVDINCKDSQARTPAYIASQLGHVAMVELLRAATTKMSGDIKLETGNSSVISSEKGGKGSHQQQVPEECKGPISGSGQETDVSKSHKKDRDKATDITLKCDGDPPRMYIIPDIDVNGKEQGLRVLGIEKAASIECDGRLQVHDRIVEINGTHLEGVCFHSAQKIFWNAMRGGEVRLKVIKYQELPSLPKRKPPPIMPKHKVRPPAKPAPLPPKEDNSSQSSIEKTSQQADVDKSLTNNQQTLLTQVPARDGGQSSDTGKHVDVSKSPNKDSALNIKTSEVQLKDIKNGEHPDKKVADRIFIVGGSHRVWCPPMTLDSDRVNSDKCQVTENGELRNSPRPGERLRGGFRKYRGTCSRLPIPLPSSPSTVTTPRYWESHTRVRMRQVSEWFPVLEMGVSLEGKVDTRYWVSNHSHSWAVRVVVCYNHDPGICTQVLGEDGQVGDCIFGTISNTSGTTAVFHYGVVLDVGTGTVAFIDLDREIVLHKFHVEFTEPLRPMFGVGPSPSYTVEMRLVSGEDITMTNTKKDLISQALTTT